MISACVRDVKFIRSPISVHFSKKLDLCPIMRTSSPALFADLSSPNFFLLFLPEVIPKKENFRYNKSSLFSQPGKSRKDVRPAWENNSESGWIKSTL